MNRKRRSAPEPGDPASAGGEGQAGERELDQRARELIALVEKQARRSHAAIERSRALLAIRSHATGPVASFAPRPGQEATGTSESGQEPARAPDPGQDPAADAPAFGERLAATPSTPVRPSPWIPDPGEQIGRARQLRRRVAATAADLAETEEGVARAHDSLADRRTEHSEEYRRVAEEARREAAKARAVARTFGGRS